MLNNIPPEMLNNIPPNMLSTLDIEGCYPSLGLSMRVHNRPTKSPKPIIAVESYMDTIISMQTVATQISASAGTELCASAWGSQNELTGKC
jgi:hypothetical protein